MKVSLRAFFWLLVAIAVVAAGVVSLMPKPIPVDLDTISRGPLRVTVDEDGKTKIRERYQVSSPLAGRSMRIELREGDPVVEGETLLVRIHSANPELLDARALAEAEARLQSSEAAVERSAIVLDQVKSKLDLAETIFGRFQKLSERGSASEYDLDEARTEYSLQRDQYRVAKFNQDIAQFERKLAEAALKYTSQDGGSQQFEIKSPITGKVLKVNQESAKFVLPGTRLIEIGNPDDLEVEIDVLSTDAVRITPGDPVLLEHWGGDAPLMGTVRLIEPAAFTKTSALGVDEQRVNVLVDLETGQPQLERLGDGFRVEARIVVWQSEDVLRVPTSALFRQKNGEWGTFIHRPDGTVFLQTIQLGQRNNDFAEVLSGLEDGQQVVVHPSDNLVSGSSVAARDDR